MGKAFNPLNFTRQDDGTVLIEKFDKNGRRTMFESLAPAQWAEIMCQVSAGGMDIPRWTTAVEFHHSLGDVRLLEEHPIYVYEAPEPENKGWADTILTALHIRRTRDE